MDEQEKRLMAMELGERLRLLIWTNMRNSFYEDPKPVTVAEAVFNLRKKTGLGHQPFARRLFVSQSTISRMETGKAPGTPVLVGRVANLAEEFGMYNTAGYLHRQAVLNGEDMDGRGRRRR